MTDIRCKKCNRLLMHGVILAAEIKCPKCRYLQKFQKVGGEMAERETVPRRTARPTH